MSTAAVRLLPERSALMVIDVQEKLAGVMLVEPMTGVVRNLLTLIEAARRLGLPVLSTEQYPKGLGATLFALREPLKSAGASSFEKLEFSVCAAPGFRGYLPKLEGRGSVLLTGMEAHICVFQTAVDLIERGYHVHLVADALISRTKMNLQIGLSLAENAGACITSTETVVMDLLRVASGDNFRAISQLIR